MRGLALSLIACLALGACGPPSANPLLGEWRLVIDEPEVAVLLSGLPPEFARIVFHPDAMDMGGQRRPVLYRVIDEARVAILGLHRDETILQIVIEAGRTCLSIPGDAAGLRFCRAD